MDRDHTLTTILNLAEELCDPHQHVERIHRNDRHRNRRLTHVWVTTQDGLLKQLAEAALSPTQAGNQPGAPSVPGSRPPLALEPFGAHTAITAHAARWCWDHHLTQRPTAEGNIRALAGHANRLDNTTLTQLLADLRRWHRQAAVITGWQQPTYAPPVACPITTCGAPHTLRVNLDRQMALCRACNATWDDTDGSIRVLAEYIDRTTSTERPDQQRVRSGHQGNGAWHNPPVKAS